MPLLNVGRETGVPKPDARAPPPPNPALRDSCADAWSIDVGDVDRNASANTADTINGGRETA
jgi:hypothetical protein